MKLSLIFIGILICLASLAFLLVTGWDVEKPDFKQVTYTMGGEQTKSYVMESEQESLFDKWHKEQRNVLAQKEWEAYMDDDEE